MKGAKTVFAGHDWGARFAAMIFMRRARGVLQHGGARIFFNEWRLSGNVTRANFMCMGEDLATCRKAEFPTN